MDNIHVCQWIGDTDRCRQSTLFGKSYCETHQEMAYLIVTTEVADRIINEDIQKISKTRESRPRDLT